MMPVTGTAWGRNLDVRVQQWRVVPAQAGTHGAPSRVPGIWIPACAGMTP